MALSREEIEEIARSVARRVVPAFKPCRCGLAMWEAHGHTDSLEEGIGAKNLGGLRASSTEMDAALTGIDEACSVNISRAKARLTDLTEAGTRGDWEVASRSLIDLRVLTREPLAECAALKEGNPGDKPLHTGLWVVFYGRDAEGKIGWHAYEEYSWSDAGKFIGMVVSKGWTGSAWAIEAPTRYQAIKIAREHYPEAEIKELPEPQK